MTYDDHSAPPPICTMRWRFTGANLNNPVAVRSQARPTSSQQILVVVMDATPGFFNLACAVARDHDPKYV